MTQQGTYHELIMFDRDIDKQIKASPAFSLFNRDKIKNFYSKNKLRLGTARAKIGEMMNEHIKKNDEGVFETWDNNGSHEWVFLTEADKEEYSAKYEAFLSRTIDIHC